MRTIGLFLTLWAVPSLAGYLPLETGNSWTYRNRLTGQSFTVRVSLPAFIGGKVYYALQGYVSSNVMVRVDEQNTLVYLDNETQQERPLVSFTPIEGAWLQAPYRPCDQESQTQARRSVYNGPAGEFTNSLNVKFRAFCADAGAELEQFVENIGMVRRVETSIAGPVQYDLVSARIGSMIINALPSGTFSVALDTASEEWTAMLRLRSNGAQLKLNFLTSQEFEVVLRNDTGRIVWRWSDGRAFTQAVQTKIFAGDWLQAVRLPRPAPGTYSLEAWLTTADSPQFAASVAVDHR